MTAKQNTKINFNIRKYATGQPVTVVENGYMHLLVDSIDAEFGLDCIKWHFNTLDDDDAKLFIVRSHARDQWQLVSVHKTRKDGHASRKNRVIGIVREGSSVEKMLDTHLNSYLGYAKDTDQHFPTYGVTSFDPKTGRVKVWLSDDRRAGVAYQSIRAAEEILEEQGVNVQ